MNKKAFLTSLVAGAAGLVLLEVHLGRLEAEISGGPKRPVLILTKDVAPGTRLERSMLGIGKIPESYLESRHVPAADLDDVLGARLALGGHANESLLWTDLASMHAGARWLSGLIPDGKRAMSLATSRRSFDQLLRPGDRVDVLLTTHDTDKLGPITTTLLQNLLVLAVGSDTGGSKRESGRSHSAGVTLSVSTTQAQALAQAERSGSLRLSLRNPEDISVASHIEPTTTRHLREVGRALDEGQTLIDGEVVSDR